VRDGRRSHLDAHGRARPRCEQQGRDRSHGADAFSIGGFTREAGPCRRRSYGHTVPDGPEQGRGGSEQAPSTQAGSFVGQMTPHPPQFFASVSSFTQEPPQALKGLLHDQLQLDSVQAAVAPFGAVHCVPHAPQLLTSSVVLTHAPLHAVGYAELLHAKVHFA